MNRRVGLIALSLGTFALMTSQPAFAAADKIAPTAPASLVASQVTSSSVQLTWSAATDNVKVAHYLIYQDGVKIDSTLTSLTYKAVGLAPSTAYSFYIRAQDASRNLSPLSPVASVTTLEAPTPSPTPSVSSSPTPSPTPTATQTTTPPPGLWQNCPNGYVAFTFDDGPNSGSAALLSKLKQYGIRATFFVVGQNVGASSVQAESVAGSSIQNHSWDHSSFTGASTGTAHLTISQMLSQWSRTDSAITAAGLPKPVLFRPPYGDTDTGIQAQEQSYGLLETGWTVDTNDWQDPPASTIASRFLAATDGGIVLMHDGRTNTIAAIPTIVSGLQSKGMCPGQISYSATPQTVWEGWDFYARAISW